MAGPLAGIRVLDLTSVVAGPLATQMLGDMGADVIKIEAPEGDAPRHTGPARSPNMAALFMGLNRSKRSLVLDLKKPAAADALWRLIAGADVLAHSMRPQKIEKLGFDHQAVCGRNPRLVYAALHGYRDGDRSHLTMHSQASTLSDQDIADIAVFFAGKPLTATGKPHGTVPQAAALCTSCHGQDGVSIAPMYPSLAGQHEDYLVRAIDEYQKGGRKNPIMKGFAASLKDEDIEAIARYFSAQTPALSTEPRPYTRFTEQ